MVALELPTEERLVPGDLIATLAARTPAIGPNPTDWPGRAQLAAIGFKL